MRSAFWLLSFLCLAPDVHAETGKQGWLRYAPCPRRLHSNTRRCPSTSSSPASLPLAHSAASELARGLHSMLGENLPGLIHAPGEDSFVLGTAVPRFGIFLPDWKPSSPIAPEGFSLSQFSAQGHNYWVLAGGTDRGELYGVFRILEQVAQQKPVAARQRSSFFAHSLGQPVGQLRRQHRARLCRAQHFLRQRPRALRP